MKPGNPLEAETAAELLEDAKTYRVDNFDTHWDEVESYDEAINPRAPILEDDYFTYVLNLPIISQNNARKANSLSAQRILPHAHIEGAAVNAIAEVRSQLLRWAFRVSDARIAINDVLRDLVSVGFGVIRGMWDREAIDGIGAPSTVPVDYRHFYIDPHRRHRNINVDCQYCAEIQQYTEVQFSALFPDYYEKYGFTKAPLDTKASPAQLEQALDTDTCEIARMELVGMENGRKVVRAGILDANAKRWIAEPDDTRLRMFSYILITAQPRRNHAYPIPPNVHEFQTADMTNVFGSLAITSAMRNGNSRMIYDNADVLLKAAIDGGSWSKPGGTFGATNPQAVKIIDQQDPSAYMNMFGSLYRLTNETAQIAMVQRGEAPSSAMSGRAIQSLQQYADVNTQADNIAVEYGAKSLAQLLDRLCRTYMHDYRVLFVSDRESVPVNITDDNPGFQTAQNAIAKGTMKGAVTGRITRVTRGKAGQPGMTETMPTSAAEAQTVKDGNDPHKTAQLVINDIQYGHADLTVDIVPERSPAERAQSAVLLRQLQALPLETTLIECGYDNVGAIMELLKAENAALQLGSSLMNDPEMLKAIQTIQENPFVKQLATNPELSARVKMLLASQTGVTESTGPTA